MPEYSVIIPTYNDSARIPRAITSVINQKFNNWELIIIDDGSTDETSKVVEPFIKDSRIKYIKTKNAGVAAARNTGFEKSNGQYIVFLDSDDEVKPELLKDFDDRIKSKPNIGILNCGFIINNEEKTPRIQKGISKFEYSNLPGSFCIKREVFKNCGGYDENLKQSENWEMMARALEHCVSDNYKVESFDAYNLIYHHQKTPEQTKTRDLHRAEATYYLAKKYSNEGVLHFKKDDFLVSAAVNFTRAGKNEMAGRVFWKIFKNKPNLSNLVRLFIFKIPFFREKRWVRNN